MDMLELCGYNYAGDGAGIPALMLRIDKDQECYDFVKWWHTFCESYGDDFSNRFASSSSIVALTLLKAKLLLELKWLDQVVFALGATFPLEIFEMILSYVPRSSVVATNRRALNDKARQKLIHGIEEQVDILFREVQKRDPILW
ncbi:hypothetical protein BDV30DRAFT_75732 [Aspergillus minisclerotigenes]|uniref:Uncharacterized protein n=1 Tax=Aspergillus minisclerotigenes TaxID=656917 RepID=A0A5N6JAT2_9EURO|nr:hypothetical protein BDV30DRAFT_75732 [Aspergillus minisclerotigenes]